MTDTARERGAQLLDNLLREKIERRAAEADRDRLASEVEHLKSVLALANKNTERRGKDRDRLAAALTALVERPEISEAWDETKAAREALNPGNAAT